MAKTKAKITPPKKESLARVPATKKPKRVSSAKAPPQDDEGFEKVIDTDKLRVEFNGTYVRYVLKETSEIYEKDYGNMQTARILYGRISRNPHSDYTSACIQKLKRRHERAIRF